MVNSNLRSNVARKNVEEKMFFLSVLGIKCVMLYNNSFLFITILHTMKMFARFESFVHHPRNQLSVCVRKIIIITKRGNPYCQTFLLNGFSKYSGQRFLETHGQPKSAIKKKYVSVKIQ